MAAVEPPSGVDVPPSMLPAEQAEAAGEPPTPDEDAPTLSRDDEVPVGWASVDADGQAGTFGGRGGEVVLVSTADALRTALQGTEPRIVRATSSFYAGAVTSGSNKTLEGAPGVVLTLGLDIVDQHNVIVRDLSLLGFGCPPGDNDCGSRDDTVEVRNSHHVWFHHVDIADGTDGNLDIVNGSSYITVSWSKFSYPTADRGHRFSNLVGSDDDVEADVGRLNVTWHDNWWADNVEQGMPYTRRGDIHVFNNLYTAAGNLACTNAGFEATLLVENNLYIGVNRPLQIEASGDMLARGNVFIESETPQAADGAGFVPPYPYSLTDAAELEALIRAGAGPRDTP